MGADYFVSRGCPIQSELGEQEFLQRMIRKRQSALFGGHILVDGKPVQVVAPAGGIPVRTLRDGQVVETTITEDGAKELDAQMASWSAHCKGCPANTTSEAFGCYGFMSYPIRLETEQWLVKRAMEGGVSALLAAKVLPQLGVTGDFVAALRARGGSFFQSSEAVVGGWMLTDGVRQPMSSDVLVELALFKLPTTRKLLPLAAAAFGLVPKDVATPDALKTWMTDASTLLPLLEAPRAADHGEEAHSFIAFFERVIAAAKGELGLVVDG